MVVIHDVKVFFLETREQMYIALSQGQCYTVDCHKYCIQKPQILDQKVQDPESLLLNISRLTKNIF